MPDPSTTFDRYRAARASVMLGFNCAPAPRDLEMVHGPWDERTASLMVILNRSNVARSMRPEGSTLVPAIGGREHGPSLPRSADLRMMLWQSRYHGPWLTDSGQRAPGLFLCKDNPSRVPLPADLPATR
jgi:hypothetical protein